MNETAHTAMTESLLPLVTRLQCRKIGSIEGSDVFGVPQGWPVMQIGAEAGMSTVRTLTELEAAVQDASITNIFIPRNTFGRGSLERILRRNSLTKTIFWEE